MRACYPEQEGVVERDDVRIFYEVFGTGEPTVLLLPTRSILHSRIWKAQAPSLARHCRVITFDGRGNGRSSRPASADAYSDREFAADALAVMDATATGQAVLVSLSAGARWALLLAAEHPERVAGAVFIGPALPLGPPNPTRRAYSFDDLLDTDEGWARFNRHYWLKDDRGFLEFFMAQVFPEPHSTKQIEDAVAWGLETTPQVLIATMVSPSVVNKDNVEEFIRHLTCSVLVIHGDADAIIPHARGARLAELSGGTLVTIEGGGHNPQGRDPVKVNLLLHDFISPVPAVTWRRGRKRRKRALSISSPLGLGHAQRDVAIAEEIGRKVVYRDVEQDGAARAAARIAELI